MVGRNCRTQHFILPVCADIREEIQRIQHTLRRVRSICDIIPVFIPVHYIHFITFRADRHITAVIDLDTTALSFFRCNDDNTIRGTGTVDCSGRCIFQDCKRLDIRWVYRTQRIAQPVRGTVTHNHTVDNHQRIVFSRQGRTATDTDRRRGTRLSGRRGNGYTGHLTHQHILGTDLQATVLFIRFNGNNGTGSIILLNRTISDHDNILQHLGIFCQNNIHIRSNRQFLHLISDK